MSVPEVVQRLVRAWDVHDVDLLMACYEPGAVVHPHGPDSPVPVAAWRDALPTFVGSFPDLGLQLEGTVAEGDRAVAEVRMTGTNTAALHLGEIDRLLLRTEATELPATYRSIDLRWVVVLELRRARGHRAAPLAVRGHAAPARAAAGRGDGVLTCSRPCSTHRVPARSRDLPVAT